MDAYYDADVDAPGDHWHAVLLWEQVTCCILNLKICGLKIAGGKTYVRLGHFIPGLSVGDPIKCCGIPWVDVGFHVFVVVVVVVVAAAVVVVVVLVSVNVFANVIACSDVLVSFLVACQYVISQNHAFP